MRRLIALILSLVTVFTLAMPASAAIKTTVKTVYTDEDSGNSLTLPNGWEVEEVEDPLVKVKFSSGKDSPLMQYGSSDLWSSLSSDVKKKSSRSEYGNSQLTKADVADLVGTETKMVEMVTLDNWEYFQAKVEKTRKVSGISFTLTSTYWILLDNGWFYIYLFSGDENHALYDEFEALLASATYNGAEGNTEGGSSGSTGYLAGDWADKKFTRSGRSSYPFVLDTPLKKCKGFTVDYLVSDVTKGTMKSDSKFQIYYCLSDGSWVKGQQFTLDDEGFASVKQKLTKAATVTKVAVHCMNAGHFNFTYSMGIKDPVS